jgi:transcriptional regulator with XRE-family HTH domain
MAKTITSTDRHVAGRIRQARLMAGMTQEATGDALGLTFQQIQKYEKGTNRVGSGKLAALAKLYGKPVAWFFEGVDGSGDAAPDYVTEFVTSRDGLTLAKCFSKMTPAARRTVVELCRAHTKVA